MVNPRELAGNVEGAEKEEDWHVARCTLPTHVWKRGKQGIDVIPKMRAMQRKQVWKVDGNGFRKKNQNPKNN